jgi:hypothetical protein
VRGADSRRLDVRCDFRSVAFSPSTATIGWPARRFITTAPQCYGNLAFSTSRTAGACLALPTLLFKQRRARAGMLRPYSPTTARLAEVLRNYRGEERPEKDRKAPRHLFGSNSGRLGVVRKLFRRCLEAQQYSTWTRTGLRAAAMISSGGVIAATSFLLPHSRPNGSADTGRTRARLSPPDI